MPRSRTSGSSPSTDSRQDDAERVYVVTQYLSWCRDSAVAGVFATEKAADEFASKRGSCDVSEWEVRS